MVLDDVRLFLFDIDGVLLAGKDSPRLLSGKGILAALRDRQLPFRLVTNTSTHPPEHLAATLRELGLELADTDLHTALSATVAAAAERFAGGRCFVVGEAGMIAMAAAAGLEVVGRAPADVVLVGLARHADYPLLSEAARCVKDGAALLGCHRNRLWLDEGAFALSCGPWLAALECATAATAETFGKPSAAFYDQARAPFGVAARHTLMVGDDLTADVHGAQGLGMRGALVLTGKTSRAEADQASPPPDLILEQVDDLTALLPH